MFFAIGGLIGVSLSEPHTYVENGPVVSARTIAASIAAKKQDCNTLL